VDIVKVDFAYKEEMLKTLEEVKRFIKEGSITGFAITGLGSDGTLYTVKSVFWAQKLPLIGAIGHRNYL